MSIPIIIVWGHRDKVARLGWTARDCDRCEITQPFAAYHRTRNHHIYFLTVQREDVGIFVVCDFCDSAYALPKDESPQIDPRWTKSDGLEALAQTTNPDVLPIPTVPRPTEQELFALLEATDQKGGVLGKDILAPLIFGGIISGLATAFLFAGLRVIDVFVALDVGGFFGFGFMVGGLVGGTFWSIMAGRSKARAIMIETLRRAIARHQIDKAALRTALTRHTQSLRRVRQVFESLT